MQHPRRFARVKPQGLVPSAATIILGPKVPALHCTLVDYSPGGACIDFRGHVTIPDRFELLHGKTKKRCRVVWRKGPRMGVAF